MVRRIITIPLCVILTIAVFSLSLFGVTLPDNNFNGDYKLSVTARPGPFNSIFIKDIPFGESFFEKMFFRSSYDSSYQDILTLEFNLTIPSCDQLYIMCRTAALQNSSFSYSSLSSFYNSSGSYTDNFSSVTIPVYEYYLSSSSDTYTNVSVLPSISNNFGVSFLRFDNVPAGTYNLSDSSYYSTEPAYIYACIGVFIISGDSPSDIVDDYINGNLSFSDSLNGINSSISSSISNATSYSEKLFYVSLGQFEIDRLTQISNDKSLSNITGTMQPSLDNTIDNFVSGSSTLESALSSLGSTFDTQLGLAETPEQAQTVAITYQVALKKLELQAQIKAAQNLDDAISDDEMAIMKDYYENESELINRFDIESFSSQLAYDTWMLQLPSDEAVEYRKFFDYIMQDSPIRLFIIIPMSMGLVSLVLGTSITMVRRYGFSRGDDRD